MSWWAGCWLARAWWAGCWLARAWWAGVLLCSPVPSCNVFSVHINWMCPSPTWPPDPNCTSPTDIVLTIGQYTIRTPSVRNQYTAVHRSTPSVHHQYTITHTSTTHMISGGGGGGRVGGAGERKAVWGEQSGGGWRPGGQGLSRVGESKGAREGRGRGEGGGTPALHQPPATLPLNPALEPPDPTPPPYSLLPLPPRPTASPPHPPALASPPPPPAPPSPHLHLLADHGVHVPPARHLVDDVP